MKLRSGSLALVVLVACASPAPEPVHPSRNPRLGPSAEPGSSESETPSGPVRVLFHSPEGDTDGTAEIAVVFDRPMISLDRADARRTAPLVIEPAIPGEVRWIGTRTVVFAPRQGVPLATSFRVKVPAGVRALDGEATSEEIAWEFATAPPRIVRSDPYDGASWQLPEATVDLYFNQPVSPERVAAAAKFVVNAPGGSETEVPARASRPDAQDPRRVRLEAPRRFPRGAEVTVKIAETLRGDEGPRPMGTEYSTSFEVYGPFHAASEDLCGWRNEPGAPCDPDGGLYLRLTNPVRLSDAHRAIRVTPALEDPRRDTGEDDTTPTIYLGRGGKPFRTYTVRIGALRDTFGNTYEGPTTIRVRTGPYRAAAHLALDGRMLEASAPPRIPAWISNVRSAELRLMRVEPAQVATTLRAVGYGASPAPVLSGAGLVRETIRPGAGPGQRRKLELDVSRVLRNGRGMLVAEFGSVESAAYSKFRRQILAVTDLAATVKISPRGLLVWVTRLSDGRPVEGAAVTVHFGAEVVDGGRTDADGFASVGARTLYGESTPGSWEVQESLVVVAQKDGDATYTQGWEGAVNPWMLGVQGDWEQPGEDLEAYVFTERGLYRPGERVRIKGLLRRWTDDGLRSVTGEVRLGVRDSEGNDLDDATLELSEFGSFAREVRIPASAPLGPITIEARRDGRRFWAQADVAEFRRAEFEVEARTDRETYARGDTVGFDVEGRYLFGAAMTGARVQWVAGRVAGGARPRGPEYEAFVFDDDTRWLEEVEAPDHQAIASGEGVLDSSGRISGSVRLDFDLAAGSERVEIEGTVHGLGGDAISGRRVVDVLPGEFLVGVAPQSTLVQRGAALSTKIVAAKLDGEPVTGIRVRAEVLRREWRTERRVTEAGRSEYVTSHTDTPAGSCEVTTGREAVSCDVRIERPGLHILRAKARDRAGREVQAATVIWSWGSGRFGWAHDEEPKIDLRPDRRQYRVGDTARILVPSPFAEAEALVTIERAGVLERRRTRLVGNTPTIEVPVDERFIPNAFVSVVLVRGRTQATSEDDGRPAYKVGAVEIRADPTDRHLSVTVTPDSADKRPGEEVQVALEVKDGRGRPAAAELTVYAVDEGVLSLTAYQTPDPFTRIYAPRGLSVTTADARAVLMTPVAATAAEEDKGGEEGGGGGAGAFRRRFDAVAFYDPAVVTDASGRAQVRFRLPDSLTAFRIMAVAAGRGAEVGAGDARVRTSKPLLLRAMLPRFLRTGDRIEAGVVVHSQGAGTGDARVRVEVEGARLEGPDTKSVRVTEGGGAEVRFAFVAESPGRARFRFRARLGDARDALEVQKTVSVPAKLETVAASGETDGRVAESLAPLEGVRPDVGGVEVTLASSALVGLEDPVRALEDYPYECTEQLASKLIPLVTFREIAEAYGLEAGPELDARIERTLARLESNQRRDGSFGLWTGSTSFPPLDAFLTSYAAMALHVAKKRGLPVAQSTLDDAARFLEGYLRREPNLPVWQRLGDVDKVFVVHALAELGRPAREYHSTLFQKRDELPVFARVLLAQTIQLAGGNRRNVDRLLRDALNHVSISGSEAHLEENLADAYDVILHSDVRATAMITRLLLDVDRDHVLVPKLVRWLVSTRRPTGAWSTTQETAWAILALSEYFRGLETEEPDFVARVRVGRTKLVAARFEGRSLRTERASIAMGAVPEAGAPLVLSRIGSGRLFYNVRLRYARAKLPDSALDRGIFVDRRYERIDPATLDRPRAEGAPTREVRAGDLVRVTLRIVAPAERRFVVVDDPLPAGLEVVNFDLATSARRWRSAGRGPVDDEYPGEEGYGEVDEDWGDVAWFEQPFYHREDRDDRVVLAADVLQAGLYRYEYLARAVTPGHFVVPPTHAEEMYSPETFGRTEAVDFTVRAP